MPDPNNMAKTPYNQDERQSIFSFNSRWADWEFFSLLSLVAVYMIFTVVYYWGKGFVETSELVVASVSRFIPVAIFLVFFIYEVGVSGVSILIDWWNKRQDEKSLLADVDIAQLRVENRMQEVKLQAWEQWNERRLKAERDGEPFNEPPPDL